MSEQVDVKELLNSVADEDVRTQLSAVFDDLSGSALRQQVTSLQEKVKTYEDKERVRTYKAAGVPESAYDVLDEVYKGELTPEAVQTFAKEKGFAVGQQSGNESTAPKTDPAAQRAEGEARLAQVNAGAIPVRDPSINDRIAEAEANGDWETSDRLKAQKLVDAARGN